MARPVHFGSAWARDSGSDPKGGDTTVPNKGAEVPDETDAARLNPVNHFDAGELGCATGLTMEFRRRIQGVEVGEVLEVVVHDPSAKVDLPSLARMMGHRVRSAESRDDGAGILLIERAR